MKNCAVILGFCLLSWPGVSSGQAPAVVGRTVYHLDDSRTESVSDPNIREMTETTYNSAGQLTVKKVFLLNEKGDPVQGNVYDGRGNLVARCQVVFDEFGRRKEDRLVNLNGEPFQQVIHEYGKDGRALPPKVVNLKTGAAPTIKPAPIDFTQPQGGAALPGEASSSRFAPVQVPSGAQPAPAPNPAAPAPVPEEKPKTNFFKRLFSK